MNFKEFVDRTKSINISIDKKKTLFDILNTKDTNSERGNSENTLKVELFSDNFEHDFVNLHFDKVLVNGIDAITETGEIRWYNHSYKNHPELYKELLFTKLHTILRDMNGNSIEEKIKPLQAVYDINASNVQNAVVSCLEVNSQTLEYILNYDFVSKYITIHIETLL